MKTRTITLAIVVTLVIVGSVGSVVAAEPATDVRPQQGNTAPANPYAPKDYRYKPGQFTPGSNRYDDLPDYPSNSPSPYQPQQQYAPQPYQRQYPRPNSDASSPYLNQGPGQIPERRPPASGNTGRGGPPPGRWAPVPYPAHGQGQGDDGANQNQTRRPPANNTGRNAATGPIRWQDPGAPAPSRSRGRGQGSGGTDQTPGSRTPVGGNVGRGGPPMQSRTQPGRFSVGGSKAVPIPVPRPQLEKLDPSDKKRATRTRAVPMGTGDGPNLTPAIKPIP